MARALPRVRLHKLGIEFDTPVSIFQSRNKLHQFNIRGASIRVDSGTFGISPQSLFVFLQSIGEVALFKQFIPFLSVLVSLDRIDISERILFLLQILGFLQGLLDGMVLVLEQSSFVCLDTLVHSADLK